MIDMTHVYRRDHTGAGRTGTAIRWRPAVQPRLSGPGHRLCGPVHGRARRLDRHGGPAVDRPRPALHGVRSAVGGQRLRAHLRRLPAAGRARRRPVRAPPGLPVRDGPVHPGQPGGRAGYRRGLADRSPGRAGRGRRLPVPRDADHHRHDVLGRPPDPGPGHLERRRRSGRSGRRDSRRCPHLGPGVALGAVREHPDRHGRDRRRAGLADRVARTSGRQPAQIAAGRRGCHRGHGRARHARLRDRRNRDSSLGQCHHAVAARCRSGPAGWVRDNRTAARERSPDALLAVPLLVGAAFFSMWYFLSLYLQNVLGFSALKTGLAFLPMGVTIIIGAQASSRILPRTGVRPLLLTGTVVAACGFAWLSAISPDSSYWTHVFGPGCLIALALGLLFTPLAAAATAGVAFTDAGLASGVLNTSRQIGGSLGLAVLATIATDRAHAVLAANHGGVSAALNAGYSRAFVVAAGLSIASALAAVIVPTIRGQANAG